MATMSKIPLSGSTNGRGIKVTTVAPIDGSDTTIHTGVTGTTDTDYVTIYAYNDDTSVRDLHLGWGGTTDPDDFIIAPVPPQEGLQLIVADLPIRNALVVVASGSTANVLVIYGHVTRIDA
jgi:hypothetical protein